MTSPAFISDPFFIVLVGVACIVGGIIYLRLHAFVALILAALVVALLTPAASVLEYALDSGMAMNEATQLAQRPIGARIARAFGNTATQIGILIAMAAIIGRCLLESGAAERIIRSILRLTGEQRSPIAFGAGSFLLGIPVFFDTVFYLMIPLAKAIALRIKKNYLLFVMMTAAGASMAHSLVPPTPGPLFLISQLDIPMHMMVAGGIIVGIFTVSSGYAYAAWANARWPTPVRDSPDAPLKDMEARSEGDISQLPPLWFSLLPILVPLVLISLSATIQAFALTPPATVMAVVRFFGEVNIAMTTGALVALLLLVRQRQADAEGLSASMQAALSGGGVIILITAAGGAFGAMLQQTGVGMRIEELTSGYQLALIPLAWLIAAIVRTSQGSATVSMVTATGVLTGIVGAGQLDFHMLYIGLAVACGSKVITWMNDSGFWIVSKMGNLTEKETLKTFSVMQAVMAVVGLIVVMIGSQVFPLV